MTTKVLLREVNDIIGLTSDRIKYKPRETVHEHTVGQVFGNGIGAFFDLVVGGHRHGWAGEQLHRDESC